MKLVIFVSVQLKTLPNPFELELDPNDLADRVQLEEYGRGWALQFPDDIVMFVEEVST